MEYQNDHALSLLPPIPGEYHYEVVGCGYGWMSLGLKTLRSARNLMQNTLDFDVINPVNSQHYTCTSKGIWLTCRVRWVYLFLSLSCGRMVGGGEWLSSSLRLASSMLHDEIKSVGSSSTALQSLQDGSPRDCLYFRILNLGVGLLSMLAKEEANSEI